MLESLSITFQRHRKRLIEFDPRITVIVGETDSGKSSSDWTPT
jgi:predicted ATPase